MTKTAFAVGDKVWDTVRNRSGIVTTVDKSDGTAMYSVHWEDEPNSRWFGHRDGDLTLYRGQDLPYGRLAVVGDDSVNSPSHYTQYPHEVIEFTEHMNFCRGNAVKYIARAGFKDKSKEIEDLEKAVWYINREIARLRGQNA